MESIDRNPLGKAMKVLDSVVDALPVGLSLGALAQRLQMAPSTAHRVLGQLEKEKLVEFDPHTGTYCLGVRFFGMASRTTARYPFSRLASPFMRDLMDVCGETVVLGLYDSVGMHLMLVAAVETKHPVRLQAELNKWIPVYAGATGLSIAAFLSEEEQRAIVARTGLKPVTDLSITDQQGWLAELQRVRAQGYSVTRGQRLVGGFAVGAPVWGPDGRVIGNLSITAPAQRIDQKTEADLACLVVEYARHITGALRGEGGTQP